MRILRITVIGLFFFIAGFSIRIVKNWFSYSYRSSQKLCLGKIIETNSLDEVKNHIDKEHMLVVFDMDNTLVTPNVMVGSDPWFNYMVEQQRKEAGCSVAEAADIVLPLFREIHKRISYKLVEETAPDLIEHLRSVHIPVIILTNRGDEQKENVLDKISEAGVPVPLTQLGEKELHAIFDVPMLYSHGIIFCGRNDKGSMLFHVLETVNYKPTKIIFVDDKYHYLASVERACMERKIPFVGLRYGRCDELVSQFDPNVADQELEQLLCINAKAALA